MYGYGGVLLQVLAMPILAVWGRCRSDYAVRLGTLAPFSCLSDTGNQGAGFFSKNL